MATTIKQRISLPALAGLLVFSIAVPIVRSAIANAASLSQTQVRMDRMKTSQFTSGQICAQVGTSSTDVKSWSVTFPTGYTVSTTAGDWTTSTTGIPSGSTAWPNAAAATPTVSGQTVTWTNSSAQTMNTGTTYCYLWTNSSAALQNPATPGTDLGGSITTKNSSSTTIDTGNFATAAIDEDQITVNATVPSLFSFALANTTDNMPTLSSSSVRTSSTPATATVNTNAKSGWQVWAKDKNAGLTSTSQSTTIPSLTYNASTPSVATAGTPGYNTGVTSTQTAGSGAITVDPGFDGTTANNGGGLTTTFHTIASSNGTAQDAVLTLKNNVAISSLTPAANDYTDTITVVGAGLF